MEALIFLAQEEKQAYVTSGDDLPATTDCWLGPTAGQVGRNHRSPLNFAAAVPQALRRSYIAEIGSALHRLSGKGLMRSVTRMVFPQRASTSRMQSAAFATQRSTQSSTAPPLIAFSFKWKAAKAAWADRFETTRHEAVAGLRRRLNVACCRGGAGHQQHFNLKGMIRSLS
jgi:hypothetical protein